MTKIRTLTAGLLIALCLSTTACGSLAGAGLYGASHTKFARHHSSLMQGAWCAYHGWRLERDVRHHHLGWAALQAALTAHHCSKLIRR